MKKNGFHLNACAAADTSDSLLGTFTGGYIIKNDFGQLRLIYEEEPAPLLVAALKFYGFRRAKNRLVWSQPYSYAICFFAYMLTNVEYTDPSNQEVVTAFLGTSWAIPNFRSVLDTLEAKLLRTV